MVAAGLFGIVILFTVVSMTLPTSARVGPLSVLVPLNLLCAWQLAVELRARRTSGSERPGLRRDLGLLGWIVLLPVLVDLTGLLAGTALFVASWLKRRGGEDWRVTIAGGLVTALLMWLLTATVLQGTPVAGRLAELMTPR